MGNELGKESGRGVMLPQQRHSSQQLQQGQRRRKKNKKNKKGYMRRGVGFIYRQVTGESLSKSNFGSAFGVATTEEEREEAETTVSPRSGSKRRLSVSALDREASLRANSTDSTSRVLLSPKRSRSAKVRVDWTLIPFLLGSRQLTRKAAEGFTAAGRVPCQLQESR